MKSNPLRILTLTAITVVFATGSLSAQVFWERKAHGEGPFYYPGHEGDPLYAYYYPNNNNWSQKKEYAYDNNNPPQPIFVSAPSNWSTDNFPQAGNVTLGSSGGGPTNYDRSASPVSLSSLTIQQDGGLNMEFGTIMSSVSFNFQGNNIADATLTASNGGGDTPIMVLPGGGTLKKTTGTSTFTVEPQLVVDNGGTIACDAGALQLPATSRYAGGVNFNAATAALINLTPATAVDSSAVRIIGAFTGINTGGTVTLGRGVLGTVGGTGGATFNFSGDTLQWGDAAIRSTAADPFINVGTINVTGSPNILGLGFTNKGVVVQSGAGELALPYGTGFTNASGSVYEFQNDRGLNSNGGSGDAPFFINSGKLLKAGGTGTSLIVPAVQIDNLGGTVQVDTGTLALGRGLPGNGGNFIVAAGGTALLNDGSSTGYYHGTYTGSGNGTVALSGGALEVYGAGGATFNLPGTIFQWTGGTISSVSAPFINAGTLTIGGPVSTYNYNAGFTNRGTIIQSGSGNMTSQRDEVTNAAGSLWDVRNDLGYLGYYVVNGGLFQKSAGNGTSLFDGAFNNSGMISVSSGTLQFNAGMVQVSGNTLTGGAWRLVDGGSGATLLINSGPLLINKGTVILSGPNSLFPAIDSLRQNDGIFLVSNGRNFVVPPAAQAARTESLASGNTVPNAGTLIIGPNSSFTVNDDYSQGLNSTLEVLIGGDAAGSGYHQLNVTGTAALAGTLKLSTVNGYTPGANQTFEIIHAGAISGGFVNVIGGTVTYTSTGVFAHPTAATGPLQITKAVSRKVHGDGQTYDINLPLSGAPGVESRIGGGNHTVVLTFTNELVAGTAGLTSQRGGDVSGTAIIDGNTMTMNLSGVTDAQQVEIRLSGVTDVAGQTLPQTTFRFALLIGDANGDGSVNAADATITRNRSGQATDTTNFRVDFNTDGSVNAADSTVVRNASGHSVPSAPARAAKGS
ncbi:MAG: dockerin type I repeat-containing protein [Verrucomicrobiota bacterium]|nr:dockerin type I repeat-containing protein [Verrucomicrobiota bacterium]